jgi:predicted amidohydrolase YtcJ
VTAELIVEGRIATLAGPTGAGWSWVESIAVREGRIVAAGSLAAVERLHRRGTRTWRIPPDHVVLPGLTDAHLHLGDASRAATELDLTGLDRHGSLAAIAAEHARRLAAGDPDGWLLGHGWSMDAFVARPHARLLDRVAPGRPVALWAHDHHARWVSGEAMRRAGIEPDPRTGTRLIERGEAAGPSGLLLEAAAGLVDRAIPGPTESEVERALARYATSLHALGVTGVHDPGEFVPDPMLTSGPTRYRRLALAGRLPLRVVGCIRRERLDLAIADGFRTGRPAEPAIGGTTRYWDGWLKLFADGSLGSRSAFLLAAYEAGDAVPPVGSSRGIAHLREDEMRMLVTTAGRAGIASAVHAIGDAAVRTALDVLTTVRRAGAASHRIEHAQLVDAADVPRFGRHGIAASVQPCHLLSDAAAMGRAWGERGSRAFPLGDLDRGGALLPFGTDAPVEPPDPWRGIVAAIARRAHDAPADSALASRQAIGLVRAIRAACVDAPRSLGLDDVGHLARGAVADLVVVPAAPLDDPTDLAALATLRPVLTVMDGAVVHGSPPGGS